MYDPDVLGTLLQTLPDRRRGGRVHLPHGQEGKRLGRRQDPLEVGVLDPEWSHLGAAERPAVPSERVCDGAKYVPELTRRSRVTASPVYALTSS